MTASETDQSAIPDQRPSPDHDRFALWASWLVVGLPAAWGISQVVVKSLALFR